MTANLLRDRWSDLDPAEFRFILFEIIGRPGQYANPNRFYMPLAGARCRVKLAFSDDKRIVAIEPGPAFDPAEWDQIAREVEATGPRKVGRDLSFSSYRVAGSWRGKRSGVQILPPPAGAPSAPVEIAEHPFILEFPVTASERWPITNFRRMREHRQLTALLNIFLAGRATIQPRRPRHSWALVRESGEMSSAVKWVQEGFIADFGLMLQDELSSPAGQPAEEVVPAAYYARTGHDCQPLRVPADLDDSICAFFGLSRINRVRFARASFWMDMASRQWTASLSASFASLAIAIEALGDRSLRAAARFRDFIDRHASGLSTEGRRRAMYALRSDILHGTRLMEMDLDTDFGWSPPEQNDKDLLEELWGLTRVAMRAWLRNPTPA